MVKYKMLHKCEAFYYAPRESLSISNPANIQVILSLNRHPIPLHLPHLHTKGDHSDSRASVFD